MNRHTVLALTLLAIVPAADAQVPWPRQLDVDLGLRPSAEQRTEAPWDFRIGGGVEIEPTYQGSDDTDTEFDPLFLAAYRADWGSIFLQGDGLGYSRMLTDRFGIVLQLEAEDTREVDDDERIAALGDQDEELELEILGRYFMGPWSLGASIAPATGDKGVVYFVGGAYTWASTDSRLFITAGADLSGSSKDNQQTDFGISPEQSAASGFPVYSPGGGLKSVGLNLNAEFRIADRWFVHADLDYERLLGDVADSPIVFDENNYEIALGVLYRF